MNQIIPNESAIQPLRLNSDFYVVTANDLIKGRQKMTLREAQLLYITMSQIVKDDTDFKSYQIPVSDLAEFMGITAGNLYRDLESICSNLMKRVVKVLVKDDINPKNKKWTMFQWVSCAEYDNGLLKIKLNDELKPFLIDLVSHYSQVLLGTLCSFNSYYAARLYQLIVCEIGEHPRVGKEEWTFTCEEIREFFQIEPNEYPRTHDLLRRTIKPALVELDESDYMMIYNYEELRKAGKGNPIAGVRFCAKLFKDRDEKDAYLKRLQAKLATKPD